jgi:hypothetical protein
LGECSVQLFFDEIEHTFLMFVCCWVHWISSCESFLF